MNNKHLARAEQLEAQIAALRKIITQGEYLAAGLGIDLYVGARNEETESLPLELGMTADLGGILDKVLNGLLAQRDWRVRQARSDLNELLAYFKEPA
jgi:hypothetical protein